LLWDTSGTICGMCGYCRVGLGCQQISQRLASDIYTVEVQNTQPGVVNTHMLVGLCIMYEQNVCAQNVFYVNPVNSDAPRGSPPAAALCLRWPFVRHSPPLRRLCETAPVSRGVGCGVCCNRGCGAPRSAPSCCLNKKRGAWVRVQRHANHWIMHG
jgi:hypothetical protein